MTPKHQTKQKAVLVKDLTPSAAQKFFLRMTLQDFEDDPQFENKHLEYMEVEFEIQNGKPVIYMPNGSVIDIK